MVQTDGTVALLDFGITGRLDERKRLAFLRLQMGATTNNLHRPGRGAAGPRRPPGRLRRGGGHPRPGPRPPTRRSHHPDRRRDGGRAPRRDQGPPRLRRPHAQGADALRQGHPVPQRGHGHHGPGRGHPGRDPGRGDLLHRAPRRPDRPRSRGGTAGDPDRPRRLPGRHGIPRRDRRHHLPRPPGAPGADPAPAPGTERAAAPPVGRSAVRAVYRVDPARAGPDRSGRPSRPAEPGQPASRA